MLKSAGVHLSNCDRLVYTAVVGGFYGSEGKGAVVQQIADRYSVHVRTGGPNAGHTIYWQGAKYAMQSLPCGWINPDAWLVIGPGAVVDLDQLWREVELIESRGFEIRSRLEIASRAVLISPLHRTLEGFVGGDMHAKIGSTGKGVGLARAAKIARRVWPGTDAEWMNDAQLAGDISEQHPLWRCVADRPTMDWAPGSEAPNTLLEGTQGYGLDLHHGEWPYVTSSGTTAMQLAADAGVSRLDQVWVVFRTYPIRVAGNSGPLYGETSWDALGLPEEHTTVTQKVRRVGLWDHELAREACKVNGATAVCIQMLDQMFPEVAGATDTADLSGRAGDWVAAIEQSLEVPVVMVGTGPNSVIHNQGAYRPVS